MKHRAIIIVLAVLLISGFGVMVALKYLSTQKQSTTNNHILPRFAAFKSNKVNSHVGPGQQFPIRWVYQYAHMPVEIVGEFELWRQIKDMNGEMSWVHKSLLTSTRYVIVKTLGHHFHNDPTTESTSMGIIPMNTVGKFIQCKKDWCQIDIQKRKGWVLKAALWGVYTND
jgi:SH3-like domain-containing protein